MADGGMTGKGRGLAPGVYFETVASPRARDLQTALPLFVGFVHRLSSSAKGEGDCRELDPRSQSWSMQKETTGEAAGASTLSIRTLETVKLSARDAVKACRVVMLTGWEEFSQCVGEVSDRGNLDYAIRGFFENGGQRCLVASLPEAAEDKAETLKLLLKEEGALDGLEEPDLVCVPDLVGEWIHKSPEKVQELQLDLLEYCRRMGDRFAILDSGPGHKINSVISPSARLQYEQEHALLADQRLLLNGAMYFPWLHVKPLPRQRGKGGMIAVPPCGHIAGIYARTDAAHGIHKAPANEVAEGVLDLERHVTDQEHQRLNEVGVNCLRSFPGRGIRVMGARTLSGQRDWRYVNIRRLFLNLVRCCERGFADLVFEVYGPGLWVQIRERMEAYCLQLFEQGALKGRNRKEAFFVKCDAEINTLEVRGAGEVICEVGLAAVMPAEFVIVRISQSAAGIVATLPAGT